MKDTLQAFLDRRLPLAGVAALGIRRADRTVTSHGYSNLLSSQKVEQALSHLALAAEGLDRHGIRPVRLCWVFEHIRIHLALRGDGVGLALFVENRPGVSNADLVGVLEEFAALAAA